MVNVAFDFDGTLSKKSVQEYAKSLIERGDVAVWIVTSRFKDSSNTDLYKIASEVGIPVERIVFTGWVNKGEFFKGSEEEFLFHLDDDFVELEFISEAFLGELPVPVPISCFGNPQWKVQCEDLIVSKIGVD